MYCKAYELITTLFLEYGKVAVKYSVTVYLVLGKWATHLGNLAAAY